jgi:hypothetical protein
MAAHPCAAPQAAEKEFFSGLLGFPHGAAPARRAGAAFRMGFGKASAGRWHEVTAGHRHVRIVPAGRTAPVFAVIR